MIQFGSCSDKYAIIMVILKQSQNNDNNNLSQSQHLLINMMNMLDQEYVLNTILCEHSTIILQRQ